MMRLILKKTVAFLLLAAMICLGAVGCAKDPENPVDSDSAGVPSDTVDSSAGDKTPTQPPVEAEGEALTYNLKEFSVIRAESGGAPAKTAADNLYNGLKFRKAKPAENKVDVNVTAADDSLEILIGATNRAESETVAAKLTEDNQFAISFRKNKIVIFARRNAALDDAVTYFLENYADNAEKGVLTANENHTYIGTTTLVELGANGVSHYSVVYSYASGDELIASASILAERIKSKLGAESVACSDDFETYPEDAKLILIGNVDETKYPDLNKAKEGWMFPEYGIKVLGNHIYVIGNTNDAAHEATLMMISRITNLSEEVDGKLYITVPDDCRSMREDLLADHPQFTAGNLIECYENPNNELVYRYLNVTTEAYESYVAALNEDGYKTLGAENVIGRNRFTTCVNEDKGQIHVAFYPTGKGEGDMHLFTSKLDETIAIPQETYDPATQKITDTTLHVMSLDYNTGAYAGSKLLCDGSGMSLVVTLEDGRFVVFDGGYTVNDGHNLYNYMKAVNKRADGEVVIAAWFISHPHDDHTGGCEAFTTYYGKKVTIENFVVNAASAERYGSGHWFLSNLPSILAVTGADLIKPHTGQVLEFCNTKFEIILTHENLPQSALSDSNNTSTVVRMYENGRTVMITGDASAAACNKMVSLYGDVLKSDILQLNHHGVSGFTLDFVQKVNPETVIWPTSQDSFAGHENGESCRTAGCHGSTGRINGGGNSGSVAMVNRWIRDNVGVENCYVADDTIEWITFVGGEIVINADTGYIVQSDNPTKGLPDTAGLLQTPALPNS